MKDFLEYELYGSWWASWIGWGWLQDLVASYYIRKTTKKYERYMAMKFRREVMVEMKK